MSNYLDKTYSALDGVLLTYEGDSPVLGIPDHLAGMEIHTIGRGAFMESSHLLQAVIPGTVKKIGYEAFRSCSQLVSVSIPFSVASIEYHAFANCPNLTDLQLFSVPLTEQQYRDLRSKASRVNGSVFLAHAFPEDERIRSVVAATDVKPANSVPAGIKRLFTAQDTGTGKENRSIRRNLDGFSFGGDERYATERDAFLQLIGEGDPPPSDAFSEEKNDGFMKTEKYPKIEKTAVFTFDDSRTKFTNGCFQILADIRIGYHFFQGAVPVVCGGKLYSIYRRNYLTSIPNLNYIRRDVTVFSENEQINNLVILKEVYAKYKLLSIL